MTVLAVLNQKGGVGKTTVALNLAYTWRARGLSVLVVDVDKQAAASATLLYAESDLNDLTIADVLRADDKVMGEPGKVLTRAVKATDTEWDLHIVPSSLDLEDVWSSNRPGLIFRLRRALDEAGVHEVYDRVILDGPPDLGPGTVAAAIAADHVIIPTRPERMSMQGVARTVETVNVVRRDMRPDVQLAGIVPTAVDRRLGEHDYRLAELRNVYDDLVTTQVVPHRLKADEASGAGMPAALLTGPAGDAMRQVYAALCIELDVRMGAEDQERTED